MLKQGTDCSGLFPSLQPEDGRWSPFAGCLLPGPGQEERRTLMPAENSSTEQAVTKILFIVG